MFDYNQILELIEKVSDSKLTEFSLKITEKEKKYSFSVRKEKEYSSKVSNLQEVINDYQDNEEKQSQQKIITKKEKNLNQEESKEKLVEIRSPMVGTFYRAPSPKESPFVEINTPVKTGETLCILEAMKLMNEFPSEISGTIKEICAENGDLVEYGDLLFKIKPGLE